MNETLVGRWRSSAIALGLLTWRIGNPSHSGMESGFPAITEPLLDCDHFFMTTNREAPKPLCHASRLAMVPAGVVQDRAADAIVHFSGIDPCSVEANLQGSIKSLRELVDVQRVRAEKAEAKLSAIHALVTTPGIPVLREHILNILRREVRR